MANLTDADKVLRNDTGKDIVTALGTVANAIQATQQSLVNLSDVNITSTPNNNDGLKYNQATGKWVNGSVASSVGQLTDVDDTNKANNTSLVYNSNDSEWQAKKLTVELTQAEYDQLKLDGDLVEGTNYVITDGQNVTCDLGDLDDVSITSASNGDVLAYNNGDWVNSDASSALTVTASSGTTLSKLSGRKVDKLVAFTAQFKVTNAITQNTWVDLGTITDVPNDDILTPCVWATGAFIGMVQVQTTGTIRLYPIQSTTGGQSFSFTINYST